MTDSPRPKSDLRSYQRVFIELLKRPWSTDKSKRLPGVILALDMGAGKTSAVLTALRDLLDEVVIRKVLVVSGLLVAKTVWPDEIDGWEHLRATTYTVIRAEDDEPEVVAAERAERQLMRDLGADTKLAQKDAGKAGIAAKDRLRGQRALEDTEIHLINKEMLPWLWEFFGFGRNWPYDVIVIDDASLHKSGKQRSKGKVSDGKKARAPLSRFGILARARKHVDATIYMTGTPSPNGLINLWGLGYLIDLGERLGTARTAFERRWFNSDRYSFRIEPKPNAEAEITGALKDIMFSLDPADYPQLPPVVMNKVMVQLPVPALAEYRKFRKTLVSEAYDVEAVSRGVLTNKLLQFANGSMYQEDGNDIWIHDAKLEGLERIVEETAGEPLLIAYSFRFDFDRIRRKYPKAVVLNEEDPRETVKRWNRGEIDKLLAHPLSAAHGLNMQYGGHHLVWYGLTPDLELYLQFNKRLARPGQTKPVFNHLILAAGTDDETILPLYLDPKKATQDRVLDAVRISVLGNETCI